jgi:hypothetical protein
MCCLEDRVSDIEFFFKITTLLAWLISGVYAIAVAKPGEWDKAAFFIALSIWFYQGLHN